MRIENLAPDVLTLGYIGRRIGMLLQQGVDLLDREDKRQARKARTA